MNKFFKLCFFGCLFLIGKTPFVLAQTSFPPGAGEAGTTAIAKDSSAIVSWATGVEIVRGLINIADPSATYNGTSYASYGDPENALGEASSSVVSLGDSGYATLTFEKPVFNGIGPDFAVFENGFSNTYLEIAFVEVSSDGQTFFRFPAVSLTQTETQVGGFGTLDPTKIHNFAGKYKSGFGTPFDLEDLAGTPGLDVNNVTHVRIVDAIGTIGTNASFDSRGNKVNEPFSTPFHSGGFDLNAVGVINESTVTNVVSSFTNSVFSVYPNPALERSVLKFNSGRKFSEGRVSVYSVTGEEVFSSRFEGNQLLNLKEAGVGKGMYIVKVDTGKEYFSELVEVK